MGFILIAISILMYLLSKPSQRLTSLQTQNATTVNIFYRQAFEPITYYQIPYRKNYENCNKNNSDKKFDSNLFEFKPLKIHIVRSFGKS